MHRDLRQAIGYSLALTGLHLIGCAFPGSLNWGFHFLGFLPAWHCALYIAAVILTILFVVKGTSDQLIAAIAHRMAQRPLRFFFVIVFLFVTCGVVFRIHIPLLGDGFYLVRNYVEAYRGIAPLYPRDEPLATYYFSAILGATGTSTFQQFLNAFLIGDLLLAIGFLINVFMIVRTLFVSGVARLLAVCFLLSPAYMQLFFGYVETYAVVLFALSFYINISVLYLYDKISFSPVPFSFLLTTLTHYLALLLLPSLLLLTYR